MVVDGECVNQRVYLVHSVIDPNTDGLDIPASQLRDCCGAFSFKVLADTTDDDEFKNDVTGFLWWFTELVDTATMKLLKWDGEEYAEEDDLDNDTYGTFYDYGFFVNDAGESFIGYQMDWRTVLAAFGAGSYKVQVTVESVLGGDPIVILSDEYCLKAYSAERANKSMRIEYYLNGIMGDNNNDEKIRDYGTLNWYSSLRLPGWFGFPGSEYAKEYTIYNNGSRQWTKDEQEQEFIMAIKRVSAKVHNLMRTDVLQADTILVTDYNANNPETWIEKSIQLTSGYKPNWNIMKSKLAGVDLKFRLGTNNLRKNRQ